MCECVFAQGAYISSSFLLSSVQFSPDPDPFTEGKPRHWAAGSASGGEECWPCGGFTWANELNHITQFHVEHARVVCLTLPVTVVVLK